MDEWTLNDLLECSVCLERLDTSSKVLPCQHTFCKKCLEEIHVTKKELRCPECRVLVETSIDDLPPNVLLMRILEGMRNAAPKRRSSGAPAIHHQRSHSQPVSGTIFPPTTIAAAVPASVSQHAPLSSENAVRSHSNTKQVPVLTQPCARAVYDYISKEPGDLSFKKGDIITLKKQVDQNWYHGEIGGVHGVFPICYVQIMPPPANIPQCKALYDFRMTNDEEEGCLTFSKGDIITVIRRVDENWAEGRLGERVGIFPIAFVEMNGVARAFMKLSSNIQPGPSRLAPPTPTTEETTPLIPTDHTHAAVPSQPQNLSPQPAGQSQALHQPSPQTLQPHSQTLNQIQPQLPQALSSQAAAHQNQTQFSTQSVPKPPLSVAANFPQTDSSSSISSSSTTPNTSSTSSSSSSSTTPSSPASPPPRPSASAWSPQTRSSRPTSTATSTAHESSKRHSLIAPLSTPTHQATSNRHSAEVLGSGDITGVTVEPSANGEFVRQGSGRNHRRSGSSELPLSSVGSIPPPLPQGIHHCLVNNSNLPATYIALYPYKPQKADELELRKGGVYTVTERCQDGWFKGTSNRTQKSGVFPGNYVAFVKSLPGVQSQLRSVPRGSVNASTPTRSASSGAVSPHTTSTSTVTSTSSQSPVSYTRDRKSNSSSPQTTNLRPSQPVALDPPTLPPRSVSPAQSSTTASSVSWLAHQSNHTTTEVTRATSSTSPQAPAGQTAQCSPQATTHSSLSPNIVVSSVPSTPSSTPLKSSSDKGKEKKERGSVSLMRRLTNMKKSKSPPPPYSMDNPVFEDGSVFGTPVHSVHQAHPIHVRSGSCPSQLLQLPLPESLSTISPQQSQPHHRAVPGAGGSQRIRHKERPNVVTSNFSLNGRSGEVGVSASAPVPNPNSHHRKSNSLDAGSSQGNGPNGHTTNQGESSRKSKQLVQPARERFRCVVPYPPHSEYELELRVGDVIYVHRKREDGWYKGTQQRTGRTGLFPASFVEAF
ncbi:E3 ubiquitin-protein ligase SH3RF1 isoform X1 [Frankliniella occidentalis]|uniref:RING-type E3 ubiquitin transferase n=1 Tax=Frankliniella occidentalis TaxID=133901 RepID=A0A6J1RSJ8_FRAOC|nr:E3 ubiquitin-protein ligase SH3RF1 isoform X1 [Frankliniella occidentalis]XP_026272005.1 E3 ubiquitin-protein ligase SH3RF1 isoform X1 [Frankliniella occidentalis]XP_052124792.1 E3 ubiquitin-protein ligase SH3RF1 isoform X1 [Frankliniella occidentalis]XP_052124795.1 E3 ubiquitin-protein ligase SH3RF1 isoform X1 [Frankliniella occidentalis]